MNSVDEKIEFKKKTQRQLLWVGILSILMFFGGLTSAYIIQRVDGTWLKIFLPESFFTSCVVIIISSITYTIALRLIKKDKPKKATPFILATLILGFVFVFFQYQGWSELNREGNFLGGLNKIKSVTQNTDNVYGEDYLIIYKGEALAFHDGKYFNQKDRAFAQPINFVNLDSSNNASSYMYLLSGLHVAHLIGGLISLIVVFFRNLRGKYSQKDSIGVQVSAIYWHFLDFLWLYLFCLLYFLG